MAAKFKLQTVLNYRKTLEDQAQQRLAELLGIEAGLKEQQDETCRYVETLCAQLQQKQQAGLPVLELRLYEDQIDHYRQELEKLQVQLEDLTAQLNDRRQKLLVAAREHKVMEKLKGKHIAEYLRDLEHKERAMLDEISLRPKGDRE